MGVISHAATGAAGPAGARVHNPGFLDVLNPRQVGEGKSADRPPRSGPPKACCQSRFRRSQHVSRVTWGHVLATLPTARSPAAGHVADRRDGLTRLVDVGTIQHFVSGMENGAGPWPCKRRDAPPEGLTGVRVEGSKPPDEGVQA
jgi:hypothetical protein